MWWNYLVYFIIVILLLYFGNKLINSDITILKIIGVLLIIIALFIVIFVLIRLFSPNLIEKLINTIDNYTLDKPGLRFIAKCLGLLP